jgi:diguanylate cyclase (GGDEF)-like protein/PAS domain S-box-containing protein
VNLSQVTESLLAHALEAVSEGSLISDADRNIIYSNAAFTEITGYEQSDIMGASNVRFLQGANTSPEELQRMRTTLDAAEVYRGTILNYRKDGTPFWNNLSIAPLKDDSGKVTNFVSVQRDVTDIVAERQKLSHRATHDQLTGLPNREALRRHLRSEFSNAAEDGSVVALGMIDLDDFKLVNDEHGHHSGDAILIQFAIRVSELLRRGDYVARLGGDEFVVVISDLSPIDPTAEVVRMLERIHTAVEKPFDVDGGASVSVGMSMGIARFPSDGVVVRDLLRSADAALYRVKGTHGGGPWWEAARPEDADSADSVAESMGAVSASGNLVMFMQPIVDLRTGFVSQVEALARIRKPDGGIELPDSFLPYCSKEQLVELFKEGLDQSLAWASRWESDGVELNVSVNIPAELLNTPDSADWVRDALARHSLQAHRLSLELLETQELDLAASDRTIAELARLGVKIHLDDLSSGFSTLKRITDIPFDVIKIDRRIFDRAHTRPLQVLTVLAAITKLGSESGYGVVVEGIEDRERLEVSAVLGAQFGQGYLFARPMPPEDVAQWVAHFTMPYRDSELTTPLGALAYHWAHSRESGPTHPSRAACPLTGYFSHAGPHIATLHDSLHSAAGTKSPASAAITAWLVERVQHHEAGG